MGSTAGLLPSVLRDERGLAFAAAADHVLAINPWLACPLKIEHAPDEVLWHLARQFGVAGPLYQAMKTRAQKERLARIALPMQRKRGTPWAMAEVMRLLGFSDAEVMDRIGLLMYNGSIDHDGTELFGNFADWRGYKIALYIDDKSRAFCAADRQQAELIAADWAPLRSVLSGWTARHVMSATFADPALVLGGVYKVVLLDAKGNRQAITLSAEAPEPGGGGTATKRPMRLAQAGVRMWTHLLPDNGAQIFWRVWPGELSLTEVEAVALVDRANNEIHRFGGLPAVEPASNVMYEGICTLEVKQ